MAPTLYKSRATRIHWSAKEWDMETKKLKSTSAINSEGSGEDRISSLSDDLIHLILSFSDVLSAIRTSVLSKRWKLIWTTLPFLDFSGYRLFFYFADVSAQNEFFDKFFSNRNHESDVLKMKLSFRFSPSLSLIERCVGYAITHNVEDLDVCDTGSSYYDVPYRVYCYEFIRLSVFSSSTIKKLTLRLKFSEIMESKWDLPALTSLYLRHEGLMYYSLDESCLMCLPCLRTLCLDRLDFPSSVSLPGLTTLCLRDCTFPFRVWNLPDLTSLTLAAVDFPDCFLEERNEFFSALVSLQNLTFSRWRGIMTDFVVNCPQLMNLTIYSSRCICSDCTGKVIVLSKKICNFSCEGFFGITFGVSELENVNIELRDSTRYTGISPSEALKIYEEKDYHIVTDMFCRLGRTKILTLDLEAIEALSAISDFLVNSPSPFYNLEFLKVPQGFKESSMSSDLRCYLLGHSPNATIVTTLHQDELIMQTLPVCPATQNLLASPVAGPGNDLASSSRGPSDLVLWQGYDVNSEFLDLLDCIAKKYPETFYYFTTTSKKLCTMKLNILCTTVKTFIGTFLTEVDAEMIAEYRALFADLQRSFSVTWLVNHLNSIEQLKQSQPRVGNFKASDSCTANAKGILQSQQGNQTKMKSENQKETGTLGTSHAVGCIGDNLFSGP